MFNNVGGKIKAIAIIQLILGCIGSIVLAAILADEIDELSLLIGLVGIAVSIVNAFLLYGLGQLVENSDIIIGLLRKKKTPEPPIENKKTGTSSRPSAAIHQFWSGFGLTAYEKKESNTSTASHYWTCEKCGCRNPKTSTSCKDCGDARY